MTIAFSNVLASTGGSGTAQSTASVTTVTGQLYLFVFSDGANSAGQLPTSLSNALGITWTLLSNAHVAIYYGICTAGSTGTFSINFGGSLKYGQYCRDTVSGITSGKGVIQHVNGSASVSKTATVTLSLALGGFNQIGNATYMAYGSTYLINAPYSTITADSGYTTLVNDYANLIGTEVLLSPDTAPNWSLSADGSSLAHHVIYAFALEIGMLANDAYSTTVPSSLMLLGSGI